MKIPELCCLQVLINTKLKPERIGGGVAVTGMNRLDLK